MTPKRLGQHFLADANWRERIALALFGLAAHDRSPRRLAADSGVWIEIGAGHGEMTELLAKHAQRVVAIEVDPNLVPRLRAATSHLPNVTVVSGDVLTFDLAKLANGTDQVNTGFHVYGNLPYYITSPIVHRLFEHADRLRSAAIVVQLEVAERIAAKPGVRDYGYFSAFTQFYARPEIMLKIPAGAFRPPPLVSSALVSLQLPGERAKLGITDEGAFLKFLQVCFAHKRKTLRNNLRALLPPSAVIDVLRHSEIAVDARAEQLTLEQFARLFSAALSQRQ